MDYLSVENMRQVWSMVIKKAEQSSHIERPNKGNSYMSNKTSGNISNQC